MKRLMVLLTFIIFTGVNHSAFAQSIEKIQNDILTIPGMNKLTVMCVSEPSSDEPYYTIKAGENHEDHFTTLVWFHVYTKPKYEIKVYDIVTDSDMPLSEWLQKKGISSDENVQFVQNASWVKVPDVVLPELNTSIEAGEGVQQINTAVRAFYDNYILKEYKSMEGEEGGHGPKASYSFYQNGDILSIVIKYDRAGFSTPNYKYKTYNLNISSGKLLANVDLLRYAEMSPENIDKAIQLVNSGKVQFKEGKVSYKSYQENAMYLENDSLKMYVLVTDLPFGDGSYTYSMSVSEILSKGNLVCNDSSDSSEKLKLDVQSLQVTSQSGEPSPKKGVFRIYNNVALGLLARIENGKVFLKINKEKLLGFMPSEAAQKKLKDTEYQVKGLLSNCIGIFVADIGQNINPVLCMLLDDNSVQIVQIFDIIYNKPNVTEFIASGRLPNFRNIISFEFGGGGEYENEGQTMFSYVTIYAIDEKGKRHEIEEM